MALNDELHSYKLIALLVILNQLPDILPVYRGPIYALKFFVYFLIDALAFTLILVVSGWHSKKQPYAIMILVVQFASMVNHTLALGAKFYYLEAETEIEVLALIHDMYKPALKTVFTLKLIALLWGGNGLFNRYRNEHHLSKRDGVSLLCRNFGTYLRDKIRLER